MQDISNKPNNDVSVEPCEPLSKEQFQQLQAAALTLKTQLETQDPEKFEEVSFAAQHAVEELGITYEEAIIQVLMGAIVESLDEF